MAIRGSDPAAIYGVLEQDADRLLSPSLTLVQSRQEAGHASNNLVAGPALRLLGVVPAKFENIYDKGETLDKLKLRLARFIGDGAVFPENTSKAESHALREAVQVAVDACQVAEAVSIDVRRANLVTLKDMADDPRYAHYKQKEWLAAAGGLDVALGRSVKWKPVGGAKKAQGPVIDVDPALDPKKLKQLKVEELRAALEGLGRATEGNKPTLVERLVEARQAAADAPVEAEPAAAAADAPAAAPAAEPGYRADGWALAVKKRVEEKLAELKEEEEEEDGAAEAAKAAHRDAAYAAYKAAHEAAATYEKVQLEKARDAGGSALRDRLWARAEAKTNAHHDKSVLGGTNNTSRDMARVNRLRRKNMWTHTKYDKSRYAQNNNYADYCEKGRGPAGCYEPVNYLEYCASLPVSKDFKFELDEDGGIV